MDILDDVNYLLLLLL